MYADIRLWPKRAIEISKFGERDKNQIEPVGPSVNEFTQDVSGAFDENASIKFYGKSWSTFPNMVLLRCYRSTVAT